MDSHFSSMLQTDDGPTARFVPSPVFTGSKAGYYFTTGKQGLGYYLDRRSPSYVEESVIQQSAKRQRVAVGAVETSIDIANSVLSQAESNPPIEILNEETLQQVGSIIIRL
jgi:hypothetical protein